MTIAHVGSTGVSTTTATRGTTSQVLTWANVAAGRMAIVAAQCRPNTSTMTISGSGWMKVADVSGGAAGTTTGTGPTKLQVWCKILDGTETGSITVSTPSGTMTNAVLSVYSKTAGAWARPVAQTANDSSSGTNVSATTGTFAFKIPTGAMLVGAASSNTNNTAATSAFINSQSGLVTGTATARNRAGATDGLTGTIQTWDAPVTTGGTGLTAMTLGFTWTATSSGPLAVVLLQEGTPISSISDTFDNGSTISAIWSGNYAAGGYQQANGRAQVNVVPSTTVYNGWATGNLYVFDQVFIQNVTPPTLAGSATNVYSETGIKSLQQADGTDATYFFNINEGNVYPSLRVSYFDASATATVINQTAQAFRRITYDYVNNNFLFDVSPNGTTWTNLRTVAAPTWAAATDIGFHFEVHKDTGTSEIAEYDNFNAIGAATTPVSSSVNLQWNVRTVATNSSNIQWNVRTAVTGSTDLRWASLATVSGSTNLLWGSLTRVTASTDLRWGSLATVTGSSDIRWGVSGSVTGSVDLRWTMITPVAGNTDLRWTTSQTILGNTDLRWGVLAPASGTLDLRWAVRTVVASSSDLRWAVLAAVTSSVDVRWSVLNASTASTDLRWSVLTGASGSISLPWDVLSRPTGALDLRWNVLTPVTASTDLRWAVTNQVSGAVDLRWGVLAAVAGSTDLRWAVRTIASSGLDARWSVLTGVSGSTDLRWAAYTLAAGSTDLRWGVLGTNVAVSNTVDLRWGVRVLVSGGSDLRWAVLTVVGGPTDLRWNVTGPVNGSTDVRWNVRTGVTGALDARWSVRTIVSASLDLRWTQFGLAAGSVDLRWQTSGKVSSSTALQWNVLGAVAGTLNALWAVRSQISGSADFRWNVRVLATGSVQILWYSNAAPLPDQPLPADVRVRLTDRFVAYPEQVTIAYGPSPHLSVDLSEVL